MASVLVEATVTDRTGRAIATLAANDFTLLEDGRRPDARPRAVAGAADAVHAARWTAARACRAASTGSRHRPPSDHDGCARATRMVVAPFRRSVETITGPTDDAATIATAITEIRATGGTAILDALAHAARSASPAPRAATSSSW